MWRADHNAHGYHGGYSDHDCPSEGGYRDNPENHERWDGTGSPCNHGGHNHGVVGMDCWNGDENSRERGKRSVGDMNRQTCEGYVHAAIRSGYRPDDYLTYA